MKILLYSAVAALLAVPALAEPVSTTDALIAAVRDGAEGSAIEIAAGTYKLEAPLEPKAGMTLKGAGMDETIITQVDSWRPSTRTLPDPEVRTKGLDSQAYLVRLQDKAAGITISDLTLRGPQLHGAIFGIGNENLHLHHLRIQDVLWAGIRTFSMRGAKIHDCEFIDAGGRWKRGGLPGVDGGITGGAIFPIWMKDSEIAHNRFTRTQMEKQDEFYGIKCRQGKRSRVHHNTIEVNFSIEFPFENDEDMEIDHNICHGTVSLPKHAGGPVPESGRTFRLHHNVFYNSYAIEFVRNGIEIDHNLFDFDPEKDHGNLISGFGKAPAAGPAEFHNNLVNNPGRGVIWINEPYNHLTVRNNHIITRTTTTPRTEGLFGFHKDCDFSTFEIIDNIIECEGQARPLLRRDESYASVIRNNTLKNVSDTDRYDNPQTDAKAGLQEPLKFECGVHGELTVDGWKMRPTTSSKQVRKKKKMPAPLPEGVEVLADLEFAKPEGHSLLLDLYRPKDTAKSVPTIVFVHGGGWKNGSKQSGRKQAWLVPHGFAIASISYRLTDKGQWPDQIDDCYAAVRWLRENAEKYGLDPERVGCWGGSAGGHLVALMGTRPFPGEEQTSSRVQAVVDWYGPSELLSMPPNNVGNGRTEEDIAKSNGAKLLGATVRDVPELAKDASALDNLSQDDAPFLIMHGDADKAVPLAQSEKLHQALTEAGVPSQLIVLEGAGHGGPKFMSDESKQAVREFFTKTLKPVAR